MSSPKKARLRKVEEEIQQLQNPDRRLQSFEYRSAEKCLLETYQPESILCRQQEINQIQKFIHDALQKKESKESLYISGIPGIGKTLCVKKVIEEFQRGAKTTKRQFQYCYLNAMKIKRPHDIFKSLYLELTSHKERGLANETAVFILDDLLRKGTEPQKYPGLANKMKIVVIDEIDYLDTRDQDVLYNLFDWTQSSRSRLAIIAISNTINFPEALKPKILSRIGNNRLIFRHYSNLQISEILKQRVEVSQIFDPKAIEFISKKIVKCASDIRKGLTVLREALYIHASQNKTSTVTKVSYADLNSAYEKVYADSFTQIYLSLPVAYKKVLAIVASHFKRESYQICFESLCSQLEIKYKMDAASVKEIVLSLSDMAILSLSYSKSPSTSHLKHKTRNLEELQISLLILNDKILYAVNRDNQLDIIAE